MYKNSLHTFEYYQPEDYKFSLDSIYLAKSVADRIMHKKSLEDYNVLDLCAGTGVIGFELFIHLNRFKRIDFLEVQNVYQECFLKNKAEILKQCETNVELNWINTNYEYTINQHDFSNLYDLIVCNPPYFFVGEGVLSPNEFKNRCRYFIDSNLENLVLSILHMLKVNASAFMLLRPGHHHGRDLVFEVKNLAKDHFVQVVDDVRGTLVVEITKKS